MCVGLAPSRLVSLPPATRFGFAGASRSLMTDRNRRTHVMSGDSTDTPLVLIPQHFGSLIFDRRTSKYLPFDIETTTLLLRLCRESLGCVLAEMDDAAHREQLTRFFEHFYRLGFFTVDLRFAGHVLAVEPPADHLTGPLAVHLEVVAACNLRCL